jgi:DNA adenine methylase
MRSAYRAKQATSNVKPFLKWVGGKRQLLPELSKHFPETIDRYCEPFLGGASVFFHLIKTRRIQPGAHIILNDANDELMQCYKMVANSCSKLRGELSLLGKAYSADPKGTYYMVRDQWNDDIAPVRGAARFVFLNKTAFNGLWRVNSQGKINMPWNQTKTLSVDYQAMFQAQKHLSRCHIYSGDYNEALPVAVYGNLSGLVIYLDPPYLGNYDKFTKNGFSPDNHKKLLLWAKRADKIGAHVVYSNAGSPDNIDMVQTLWPEAIIHEVEAKRSINSDGKKRGAVPELIAVSRQK